MVERLYGRSVVFPERRRVRLVSVLLCPQLTKLLFRPVLSSSSPKTNVPETLLSFLERLESFPVVPTELKSFWVEELQAKPAKSKKRSSADSELDDSGTDNESDSAEDDWRKFFDEMEKSQKKPSEPSMRRHQMTVHQSLHSLNSHRAVFTRLWLRLLPRLTDNERSGSTLSLRVLNVLHHGVLPHLTRAVMVMDWVGSCVDYGKFSNVCDLTSFVDNVRRGCRWVTCSQRVIHSHARIQFVSPLTVACVECGHSPLR